MEKKRLIIVIPSYEPDNHIIELINKLNSFFNDFDIIVINDGSKNYVEIFDTVKGMPNVTLLTHEENKGKGAALKTAFKYIKEKNIDSIIVTADSDGQHSPNDIKRIYDFYLHHENSIVLGSRKFENEVPKKSKFGNDVSRFLLRAIENKHLNDTQTGLRAFNSNLLDFMINVKGSRFEYEINMLSKAVRNNIEINELEIETIYINENKGSHFKPVKDFMKISLCQLKYAIPGFVALIANIILFIIAYNIFDNIPLSALVSAFTTFEINILMNIFNIGYGNNMLFASKYKYIRYIISSLALIGIFIGLTLLFNLFINSYILLSIIVNLIVFILFALSNYFILKKSILNKE